MKDGECCGGGPGACRADTTGAMRCLGAVPAGCVAAGGACAVTEQCCGGLCRADGLGALSCHSQCAPLGARCNAAEDCCAGVCAGPSGATVCVVLGASTTPPPAGCAGAGEPCDPIATDCCAGTICAALSAGGLACAPVSP